MVTLVQRVVYITSTVPYVYFIKLRLLSAPLVLLSTEKVNVIAVTQSAYMQVCALV